MREANCKMITIRKLKTQQRRSTATERLSVCVKPRKGMLRNKTNKPRRLRKKIDIRSGEMFYRKVRKTECSEKGGVSDLELRRKESKGGYQ